MLAKSCQKFVKKMSESSQKVVNNCQKVARKLAVNCQKVVRKFSESLPPPNVLSKKMGLVIDIK